MAIQFIEGFDSADIAHLPTKGWATNGSNGNIVAGRIGGSAWQPGTINSVHTITKTLPTAVLTAILGFAYKVQTTVVATSADIAILRVGTTLAARIMYDPTTNKLSIRNSAGTILATGTTSLVAGQWYYIEFKAFANGASGTVELRLNGVAGEIASTVGNVGSAAFDNILLPNASTPLIGSAYDDLYFLDTTGGAPQNTFLGDVRVQTLFPNGDGTTLQWTPLGGGSHYTQVNESSGTFPDDDTTYVSDSTVGDVDTYTYDDVSTSATVYGVQVSMYARKDDVAVRQIAPVIRQGGVNNVGNTFTLTSSFLYYSQIYNADPAAASWTPTNVNADEYGAKVIA